MCVEKLGFEVVLERGHAICVSSNCEDFTAKGVKFSIQPTNEDGYKMAKFLDLDGNEFWLFVSSLAKKIMDE